MTVGLPVDNNQVNTQSGNLARNLEAFASQAVALKQWSDAQTEAVLTAPPFNYTAEEVATLKSAITDMALVADLYSGNATLAAARDLGVFSRQLAGLYLGA